MPNRVNSSKTNIINKVRKLLRVSLLTKMVGLMSILVTTMILALGFYYNQQYSDQVWEQSGERALSVALSVASIPAVRHAFEDEHPEETIQPIAEDIRVETGAEFIVVGNDQEIRYSHPLEDRIGHRMVGEDNDRALLEGESYVSRAVGSLGPSIRGKTPVYDDDGEIIGVVSVGFLQEDIELTAGNFLSDTWVIIAGVLGIGFIGSFLISFHVKESIHGLEPEEIGKLFNEKEAIMQSIHEGMIAIDEQGNISMINQKAREYLQVESTNAKLIGDPLTDILPNTGLLNVVSTGNPDFNSEMWIGEEHFVVNRVPIFSDNEITGAVATFRNRTEIRELSQELSHVKEYAEGLRAQTHEFSNKLYTISGLLQLKRIDEVIEFIDNESRVQQEWMRFLVENVSDKIVSGVLLGKLNRAMEIGVNMTFDKHSSLLEPLLKRQKENIVTILGNVIENAVEAASLNKSEQPHVHLTFTDIGTEFIFEIEDNGPGIVPEKREQIFQRGFSTKSNSKHRGVGLALAATAVKDLNGSIFIEESNSNGTCFVIALPKQSVYKKGVM
ncbi:ATP-binding protein [Salipaludibacillus keqinensis]|uniref:ATP-binding protein n=1 Tax=Salipaludibacillus keqinensis TaxID=2045207 RepID=UPI001E3704F1|nr:sensor histidine kinase [Salipaludibacillus keqinensis]